MNTEILLDHEPVADGGYLVRALLRITGEAPDVADRPPLDLAVVLDRSGSMHALGKLDRAKEAASLLVRRIGDEDILSIVAYDDDVRTIAPRTPGSARQELLARIDAIDTGGMTNLSGGWLRGRELVAEGLTAGVAEGLRPGSGGRERPDGDGDGDADLDGDADGDGEVGPGPGQQFPRTAPEPSVSRVLLLTDGLANVGITDHGQLRDLVASAAANGISTTTIGFGADYDERLLRALAEAGGGSTYYIEEPDQAPPVFEAEIEGLMALAAQNVTVTVAPADTADSATVLHQYPRQRTDDGSLRLELGDLYALEPKSLLMEFLISDAGAAEANVATLTIEGHVLLQNGGVEKRTITLPIRVERSGAAVVNPEVRRELLLLEAATARDQALDDRARGAFEAGARKLREVAEKLAPAAPGDEQLQDELDDLRDLADRFEGQRVSEADAKYMHQRAYSMSSSKRNTMESLREARARERESRRESDS